MAVYDLNVILFAKPQLHLSLQWLTIMLNCTLYFFTKSLMEAGDPGSWALRGGKMCCTCKSGLPV